MKYTFQLNVRYTSHIVGVNLLCPCCQEPIFVKCGINAANYETMNPTIDIEIMKNDPNRGQSEFIEIDEAVQ